MKTLYSIILLTIVYISLVENVYANTFTKHKDNPIITPSQTWEKQAIAMPSIIYKDGKFKMWYSGKGDNGRWQIGYAESLDGINWNKHFSNPVYSRIELDNKDVHDQTVIFDENSNQFIMWYVASQNGGTSNYQIYRAVSIDGINWNNSPTSPVYINTSWNNSYISAPFVLKETNDYKMWYISKGSGDWKLGLASSTDGINWTDNLINPVLISDKYWEGNQIGGVFVKFENDNYKLYYGTNDGLNNIKTNISYATSLDGINWNKDENENPIISPDLPSSYDSGIIGEASLVKKNNINYLFYNSYGNDIFSFSLATDAPIPSPTPEPTSTPFPTATPIPSPTPTYTPTPTPSQTNKVVFIPGFGGSWNQDAILSCNLDTNPTNWQSWFASEQVYNGIFDSLAKSGFEVLPFYYDWRKLPSETANNLKNFIIAHTDNNEKVHIVSHSMGGLIARAYIEQEKEHSKIDKLLTSGTPHQGVVQAYPAWSAGQTWGPFYFQIAAELAKFFCFEPGLSQKELLRKAAPSIQTMLPTFDYLRLHTTNIFKPVNSMIDKNPWLIQNTDFNPPYYGITVGSLGGTGKRTQIMYTYIPQTPLNVFRDEYADGRPVKAIFSANGDGTVLTDSSLLHGTWSKKLKLDHTELIRSKTAIQNIIQFLLDSTSMPDLSNLSAINTGQVIIANDGDDIEIITPKKQIKKREKGIITLADIQDGSYLIHSKGNIGRLLIIQILNENKIFVKEYSDLEVKKSKRRLNFLNNKINKETLE